MANKQRLRKWRDALRSRKYTQAHGTLKDSQGNMCCLGVVCDISKLGHWEYQGYRTDDDIALGTLNGPMLQWLDVIDRTSDSGFNVSHETVRAVMGPEFTYGLVSSNGQSSLSNINDSGASFEEIADILTLEFNLDAD